MKTSGVAHTIKALTLDLDDTLWPVLPAVLRAEHLLESWLAEHAPATARRFDVAAMRSLRASITTERPEWAHDLTRMRLESLTRALRLSGDDPALATSAFEVFLTARNQVDLFDDALPMLAALAQRWPIFALTNGNADLQRIGLAHHFTATISAREVGVSKPDARIFQAACQRAGAAPHEVLHIGDHWLIDVVGAKSAGLRAAWLCREDAALESVGDTAVADVVVRDLHQLVAWLGA